MNRSDDRRNPYLVLGIPYGVSKKEIRRGFARRSKSVRSGEFNVYRSEDLNWALHRLEEAEQDPEVDLEFYRVPADLRLLGKGWDAEGAQGFFNPPPEPLPRATGPLTHAERCQLAEIAVSEWLSTLLSPDGEPIRIPYPSNDP